MKRIIAALLVLFSPVVLGQELVIKKGQRYMVVTTTCEKGTAPLKVDVQKVKPGKTIRIYTVKGSQKCRIKTVKTLV